MFKKKERSVELIKLDTMIGVNIRLLEAYDSHDPEEYARIMDRLERLYKLKELEKQSEQPQRVSPDTWALIGANLAGIVLIMTHEFTHPITTKALSLAIKPK